MAVSLTNVTNCKGAPAYFWYTINFSVFGIGLVILILYTIAKRLFNSDALAHQDPVARKRTPLQLQYIKFHVFCEELASACNMPGKMMIILLSVFNQISWTMDIYEVTRYGLSGQPFVICTMGRELVLIWIDFFINLYFFFHFIIRFIAASSKLRFWVRLSSLVDFMTVPSSLYAVTQTHQHMVPLLNVPIVPARLLNYIRAVRFLTYTEALVYLGILTKGRHIRLSQLIFTFLAVWCAGTGLMHLLENTGDFWAAVTNSQAWTYWETNYFLLVTMSTVGYGDYSSKTVLGRIFVCIFILTALAMFGTFIPEIMSIASEAKLSTATFTPTSGQAHVIVCGNFNPDTMKSFLKGFYHPDYLSSTKLVKMVVVCSDNRLDLETRAVFKQFNAWIHRFDGSVNSPISLEKIKLNESDGVIILSNLKSIDGDEEDNSNIMRIVSVKISSPDTRVIVLLRHYRNKFLLHNFPLWKNTLMSPNLNLKPDLAVCMEELKMGLLAQNCMAPGASTLLVNLLINVAPESNLETWRGQFGYGAAMEIYGVAFSNQFDNIPFAEAAEICYRKWSIGLLAVDVLMNNGTRRVVINPSHSSDFVLKYQTMRAFILAPDLESANQLQSFCYDCHYVNDGMHCDCEAHDPGKTLRMSYGSLDTIADSLLTYNSLRKHKRATKLVKTDTQQDLELEMMDEDDNALFDVTGTFHWCQSADIDSVTMTPKEAKQKKFTDHVVLCLLSQPADGKDMSIGLCNFVMPLRFHYIAFEKLKPIVIIGSKSFIADNEWMCIQNFPKIHIVEGNPLNSAHLRAAGIRKCAHCVILSDNKNSTTELSLVDKNSILCGMSAMQFIENSDIRTTIEIANENNVHYFSTVSAFEQDCKLALQLTEPFSRGLVLSSSVLYSTLSSAYYSPEGLNFVLSLISGASIDIERMMGEGFGLVPEDPNKRTLRYGCHMTQLSMTAAPFTEYPQLGITPPNFGELFTWAMNKFGIFCLGLYRLRNEVSIQESKMYFVFTFPPKDTLVLSSDKLFCLIPPTQTEITNLDTQDV